MITKLCIPAFFAFAVLIHAAKPESAKAKPSTLHVHAGSIQHTFICAPGVEASDISDGVIHASLHRGAEHYLVIAYSEPSRPGAPMKRCGSGIESYLVWLHIRASTIVDSYSVQYESCWRYIGGGPPKWSGQFLIVEYERDVYDPGTKQTTVLRSKATFDSQAPEKGIQISEQPPELLK